MMKLFMVLLGCKPPGRKTEQHDIFFGISETLRDLVPRINQSWQGAGKIHIDAWREVNFVDGYDIKIIPKSLEAAEPSEENTKLFFINLGGYKQNEFEEFHYKMLVACANKTMAIVKSKASAFYLHTGFKGATSHIDDKYGVDVDDIMEIEDILDPYEKEKYTIQISPTSNSSEDDMHLGYFILTKL